MVTTTFSAGKTEAEVRFKGEEEEKAELSSKAVATPLPGRKWCCSTAEGGEGEGDDLCQVK
jgi:hypothetical protein